MTDYKEQLIQEIIEDAVSEMQDVLSLRINDREIEQEGLEQDNPDRFDELSSEIAILAEESKILGEIRDDNPLNTRHKGVRQALRSALDLHEFARDAQAALKNAEEELMLAASNFMSEKDELDEDAELENGDGPHPLAVVFQAKADILATAVEKLREKELSRRLQQVQEMHNTVEFTR